MVYGHFPKKISVKAVKTYNSTNNMNGSVSESSKIASYLWRQSVRFIGNTLIISRYFKGVCNTFHASFGVFYTEGIIFASKQT